MAKPSAAELAPVDPIPQAEDKPNTDAKGGNEPSKGSLDESSKDASKEPLKDASSAKEHGEHSDKPPQPPPRPKLERQDSAFTVNLKELATAFPDKDENLRRALLVAANNDLPAAFNGMLALTDSTIRPTAYVHHQISEDERLARKLAARDQARHEERRHRHRPDQHRQRPVDSYRASSRSEYNEGEGTFSSFWNNLKTRFNGEVFDDDTPDNDEFDEDENVPGVPLGRRHSRPAHGPQGAPKLPPRTRSSVDDSRTSVDSTRSLRKSREPRKAPVEAPQGSVNVFGDVQTPKSDEQEPDAFFIGESDDELGLLESDEDDQASEPAKPASEEKPATEEKTAKNAGEKVSDVSKDKVSDVSKDKASEARSLLNKVKNQK